MPRAESAGRRSRGIRVVRAVRCRQHAVRHVGVEPFVQVRLLELVGGEESVEELVAELVDRDALGTVHGGRRDKRRTAGDEGRILHAAGGAGAPGGIHDRQSVVGIRSEDSPVAGDPRPRGAKVALALARVLGLEQENQIHVVEPRLMELVPHDEIVRIGRPREVVHARLPEPIDDPVARRRGAFFDLAAGRADLPLVARGHVDRDVVVAEVGEELARGVVLVAVPAGLLKHAELRETTARRGRSPPCSRCGALSAAASSGSRSRR